MPADPFEMLHIGPLMIDISIYMHFSEQWQLLCLCDVPAALTQFSSAACGSHVVMFRFTVQILLVINLKYTVTRNANMVYDYI